VREKKTKQVFPQTNSQLIKTSERRCTGEGELTRKNRDNRDYGEKEAKRQ